MTEILRDDLDFDQAMATTADGREIILVNLDDGLRAFANVCPHIGIGLDWGNGRCMDEHGALVCAMHGARFRATDGALISGPCSQGLTPIAVHVDNGQVVLDANQ